MHLYRRGHGFKSCTGLNFLSSVHNCKAHFHIHEMFSYTSSGTNYISQIFLNLAVMTYDKEQEKVSTVFLDMGIFFRAVLGVQTNHFFWHQAIFLHTGLFSSPPLPNPNPYPNCPPPLSTAAYVSLVTFLQL